MGYEVYKDKAGEYRFRYRSKFNGEIQVTSEGYTTRTDAYRGIDDFVKAQLLDLANQRATVHVGDVTSPPDEAPAGEDDPVVGAI